MKIHVSVIVLAGLLPALTLNAAALDDLPAGIELRDYIGWEQSIFINATETPVQVVIVPAVGGRVADFSLNGDNILFENAATRGRIMAGNEELWLGGYQCDLGPSGRGLPAHLQLFQGRNG